MVQCSDVTGLFCARLEGENPPGRKPVMAIQR